MILPSVNKDAMQPIGSIDVRSDPNFLDTFFASSDEILANGPVSFGINAAHGIYNKFSNAGDMLTEDEWRDSESFRHGVEYDKIKNADGTINSNWAQVVAQRHDKELERLAVLSSPDASTTAKITGAIAGFVLDPINIAAGS